MKIGDSRADCKGSDVPPGRNSPEHAGHGFKYDEPMAQRERVHAVQRAAELAVTELEVATLAFSVVNIFIWFLWWDKPLDIQRQIIVGPPKSLDAWPIIPLRVPPLTRFRYAHAGPPSQHNYDPLSSTSVPSFWSPLVDNDLLIGSAIAALAGTVFGAIHCAAWNNDFLTAAEMWIWKSCSVGIAANPVVGFLAIRLSFQINETAFEKTKLGEAITIITGIVIWVVLLIYILARLILIVLPLTALRSFPPSAFVDVNWGTYIPHI
ncbi:hypothetical protein B0H14DRAFT_3442866 [Mycena olivaceomarginata]|nr:hypothetical protein B0H14DRAFT_3442866 [Mycena olivaceomarginata]